MFEAFIVFYLLECLVLITAYVLYFKQSKPIQKKIHDPWGFWNNIK